MRQHALLSPSAAHKWLHCTPSARFEEQFADTSSSYADEGTLAHSIAETVIKYRLSKIGDLAYIKQLEKHQANEYYSESMFDYCDEYATFILEQYNDVLKRSGGCAEIFLEETYDLREYIPEGFGHLDVAIIGADILKTIDFKYGRGVEVEAENNPQLMIYSLGALLDNELVYNVREIEMTIYQPRMGNISTFKMSKDELIIWAEGVVKPNAQMAFNGEGTFIAGEHCLFCKGKAICKTNAELNLRIARYEFSNELSDDQIVEILGMADRLVGWVNSIKKYAFNKAVNEGKKWKGWKLVKGRADRKYVNEDETGKFLMKRGYRKQDIFKTELLGITEMEKFLTKKVFNNILAELYVIKPEGAPTLVPETDKRPEIDSLEAAKEDFGDFDLL